MGFANHPHHDKGYKLVLSKESVFLDLLKSFVAADWVQNIDPISLTKLDKSYILPDFMAKEADLVYLAKVQDKEVFFYILFEHQSSVDFQMPYRLLEYMAGIWRDALKNTAPKEALRKDFKLPAIIPIVLYNGPGKWTVCRSFKERIHASELFGDYQVDFKYYLLQVSDYTKEQLLAKRNLISLIFLFDQTPLWWDAFSKMAKSELVSVTEELDQLSFELLTIWLWQMTPEKAKDEVSEILKHANPKEAEKMYSNFTEAIQRKFDEAMVKGKYEGKLEGKIEGKHEAKIEYARKMLAENLPDNLILKITELSPEQLDEVKTELNNKQ